MNTSTKNIFLIIGLMILTSISNIIHSQCNANDFHALKELYDSTNGAGWTGVSGWELVANNATPPPVCDLGSMTGITVDGSNRVSEIDLNNSNLDGTLPIELGDLSNLIELELQRNELTGSIPIQLGSLANLEILYLFKNNLSGIIPTQLGTLASLKTLWLGSNVLTGSIPAELGNLANLSGLSLFENKLSGSIPSELGSLSSLLELHLYRNDLTGSIPPELGNLANLSHLQLFANYLAGDIPTELGNLANLNVLSLGSNDLTGNIPSELGDLSNLGFLSLSFNKLTGNIPSELGNLSLSSLELSSNDLSGCYDHQLSQLCDQGFTNSNISSGNNFDATWEDFCNTQVATCTCNIDDFNALRQLYLETDGDNWTNNTGWELVRDNATPPPSCYLTDMYGISANSSGRIECIALGNNNLVGTVTPLLGNMIGLTKLYLNTNDLIGEIPDELGNLPAILEIGLNRNDLTGEIPGSLGNLSTITNLNLSFNQLTGSIPQQLGFLSNLSSYRINDNDLSGCFDANLLNICAAGSNSKTSLNNNFDANWDDFCNNEDGICPPCTADDFNILRKLYIATDGDNWIDNTGWELVRDNACPPSSYDLGSMHGIFIDAFGAVTSIDLSYNNLSGSLIPELGYLTELTTLKLNNNTLDGVIPTELGELSNLTVLYLYANTLSGSIPAELGSLLNLKELELNNNSLDGAIPSELGNLINLDDLRLFSNSLSGPIPPELENMASLNDLNLGGNMLDGSIPVELGSITSLSRLNLSDNLLDGAIPPVLGSLPGLSALFLSNNDLSGCFHPNLSSLCALGTSSNANISDGNDFDMGVSWEAFCSDNTHNSCLDCATSSGSPQFVALEKLYLETNGSNWTNKSGWDDNTNCDPCGYMTGNSEWYGIECDPQKLNVVEINLNSNNLVGTIPEELKDIPSLEELKLYENMLSGNIPSDLGELINLEYLSVRDNMLVGNIPSELGNLTQLDQLYLSENQLSGNIPAELGMLTNLEYLNLSSNQLDGGIPSELGNLTNLILLRLHDNDLTGCYPANLLNLCGAGFTNANISDGNSLNDNWVSFCNAQGPYCIDCTTDDVYWTGGINFNWANGGNWDTGCIPNDNQNVWIETLGKQVNVNNGVLAEAKSIHIKDTNLLFIKTNGDLVVGPGSGIVDTTIINYGRINNRGDVSFRNVSDVNIYNEGVIQNGFSGASSTGVDITIDNTSQSSAIAIVNKDSILNYKPINTMGGHHSIQNEGEFYNYKDLNITGTHSHAIWNKSGSFRSEWEPGTLIPASITIHDLDLLNTSSNGIYNQAFMWNNAEMTISNVGANGIEQNDPNPYDTQISYLEGSSVTITGTGFDGFRIGVNTTGRLGKLNISNAGDDGIENNGFFQDRDSSDPTIIDDIDGHGLNNKGRYINTSNAMIISNPGGNGIFNEGEYILQSGKNTTILDATVGGMKNLGEVTVSNATLFISGSPYGIENGEAMHTNSEFIQNGQVNIDNCGDFGLHNYAIYNIGVDGNLIITNTIEIPFESILGSEFECLGFMNASH